MAVDSVNGNNNTALYTGIGTVAGAGGGVATGYLTRPFLKNGAPTDEFSNKIVNAAINITPEKTKTSYKTTLNLFKELHKASTVENFKDIMINFMVPNNIDNTTDALNHIQSVVAFDPSLITDEIKNANTVKDIKQLMSNNIEDNFNGKSLEELKDYIKNLETDLKKGITDYTFLTFWDSDKKKFIVDENDEFGKTIKGIARKIQGKYAAIYGSLGAAALGIGTYLCCRDKQPKTQTQTPDNKVQS